MSPHELFRVHKWREDVENPSASFQKEFIREQSEGKLDYDWACPK